MCINFILIFFLIKSMCALPDCPGGGKPDGPDGRRKRTVSTAAFPPEHGSIATGLGAPWEEENKQR